MLMVSVRFSGHKSLTANKKWYPSGALHGGLPSHGPSSTGSFEFQSLAHPDLGTRGPQMVTRFENMTDIMNSDYSNC